MPPQATKAMVMMDVMMDFETLDFFMVVVFPLDIVMPEIR
jgi:hypothetical protein